MRKEEDFKRFIGDEVKITTENPIGGRRNFSGTLLGIEDSIISIDIEEGKDVGIPLQDVKKARLKKS